MSEKSPAAMRRVYAWNFRIGPTRARPNEVAMIAKSSSSEPRRITGAHFQSCNTWASASLSRPLTALTTSRASSPQAVSTFNASAAGIPRARIRS